MADAPLYEAQYTADKQIQWKNYPDTQTPLSAANLQKAHAAIQSMDNRLLSSFQQVDVKKLDKTVANNMCTGVEFNSNTGTFVFHFYGDNVPDLTINTNLEKVVVNFAYNPVTQKLELTQDDGTLVEVDLSDLIATPDVTDSDTIDWTIHADGSVSADIKSGSITDEMIEAHYLSSIMTISGIVAADKTSADYYAKLSKSYANGTSNLSDRPTENVDNADYYRRLAQQSAIVCGSIQTICGSILNTAGLYKDDAEIYASNAQAWAVGIKHGQPVPPTDPTYNNSAEYWAGKAQEIALGNIPDMVGATDSTVGIHGLVPAPQAGDQDKVLYGDATFKELPTFQGISGSIASVSGLVPAAQNGDEEKFLKGDGSWDEAGKVKGVKGNAESTYRKGNVNITPAQIGYFTASTASIGGTVPPATSEDAEKALLGDGTWGSVDSGEIISFADFMELPPEERESGDYYIPDFPITASTLPIGGSVLPIGGSSMPVAGFDTKPMLGSFAPVTSDGIARSLQPISGSIQTISGQIGDTDISDVGATVTGAINKLNNWTLIKSVRGSSTKTYSSAISEIYDSYSSLSANQKINSILTIEDDTYGIMYIFNITQPYVGTFESLSIYSDGGGNGMDIYGIRLNDRKYYCSTIRANGASLATLDSNNFSATTTLYLYVKRY